MGVKGLTTYVRSRSWELLEQHKLHGGYVVIDGESLAIELYKSSRKPCSNGLYTKCAFGGDYNIFIRHVEEFFDKLEKCKVTPLVLMDGGLEKKKMKTKVSRKYERMLKGINYTPTPHSQNMFLPVNTILVFTAYLQQRQIKVVRCVFENDPCIAGVSKILNCPVLSSDSDFYIFGVEYIPYSTLETFTRIDDSGHAMYCDIFRPKNLLRLFPGLDHSELPLLAVLLGNDYIETKVFQNFFRNLEIQYHLENHDHSKGLGLTGKINLILTWLSKLKLSSAVAAILSTLPVQYRQKLLDSIQLVVDGYLVLPFDMLEPLGFEYQKEELAACQQKKFVFPGNICTLEAKHYWENYEMKSMPNLDDYKTELLFDMQSDLENRIEKFAESLPLWFQQQYTKAELPSSFITRVLHRLYLCDVNIEDPTKPSAEVMTENLFRVIDGLLVAGRREAYRNLTYVIREGTRLVTHEVPTVWGINSIDFPALTELPFKHLSIRKRIFDETLEISGKESLIEDIPPEWKLFIATALYWIDAVNGTPPNTCHVYALLFTMLLGVVEEKSGKYQALKNDRRMIYQMAAREIKKARRKEQKSVKNKQLRNTQRKDETNYESCDSIIKALQAVTDSDCLRAASLFLENYGMNKVPFENSHEFDVSIVHVFSQFQCCLKHAIQLNALLGYPYKPPVIEKLFNGTVLYNLYIQFEKHLDVESYISVIIGKTPSLLHLLNLVIDKMKMLVHRPIANGYRRDRNKMKAKTHSEEWSKTIILSESEETLDENEFSEQEQYDESIESNVEHRRIYTLKARKLLNSNCASDVYMGKGVTKRKLKKKRSNQLLDECGVSEKI